MDDDLRAALFEDVDQDGDFEELQDDFIAQVFMRAIYVSLSEVMVVHDRT